MRRRVRTFSWQSGFSERVTDFDLNNVSLTGPATATNVVVTPTIGLYRVVISPNDAADGEVTVKINAGVVTDGAGNKNTASTTVRFRVDTRPPTPDSGVFGCAGCPEKRSVYRDAHVQ